MSIRRCTSSYSGMPFQLTKDTSRIITGAITHRIMARPVSMVRVTAMPPTSRIGARMPMVWIMRTKFCTL